MNTTTTLPEQSQSGFSYLNITVLNITVSEKGLSELNGTRRVVFIPREKVRSVEIKFGSRAERPGLQTLLALGLLALGGAGLYIIFESGMRGLRWGAGLLIFGGLGAFSLYEVLHQGHYLLVISDQDKRKLILKGRVKTEDLDQFIQNAGRFGYHFRGNLGG